MSSRKNKFADPLQSTQLENETFPNPYYLYFPIASTIAYMVVSVFDWVLLGSLVIGFSLGYSVVGSSLESLVIGSSLRSSLGSSALLFWYAVCYQLHQQLEEFAMIFDSFLWKFDSITGYLDKFLKREKGFILDFWLVSEYTKAESFIFRSIHPEVFQKIAFLKDFSKFLQKLHWRGVFQRSYRPKTGLLHGCYPVKQLFFMLVV